MLRFVTNRRCPKRIASVIMKYHERLPSDELRRRFTYYMLYVKGQGHRWTWSKWNECKAQFESLNYE